MILTRNKGSRMWGGGGGTGGSGGGGGLDPSALAGYASMGWVDDNYVSKDYFNQLFKVKVAVRVLVTDPSTTPATVISDTTTVRQDLLYPNEVPESTTTTDEETGYVTSTSYSIDSIQVMGGVWTNSYVSALGQNSSGGGGGGGGSLNEPLSSINMAGLSAPGAAQDGMTIVWDQATGRWKYGSAGAGSVTSVGMTVPSGFNVSPATITSTGIFAITFASGYSLPTTAKQSNWDTAYGWGNHANAGYATQSWVNNQNFLTQTVGDGRYLTIDFFRSLFRAYNSSGNEVQPNTGDTSTIDNIKAMFGFWTNAYISALGQNSSGGGGGGGSSTLAGLNDVQLGTLNANDVLIYDGNGHWINTSKSSFLSGYVTTSDISDMATKTWVGLQGYLTGITSSMVTTALGFTPMNSTVTFWGQSVSNGVVSGSMTDVGNITFDGSEARRISPNGTALFIGNSDNANWVYMADMASQSGDSYWKIYSSGYAHFKRLYLDTNVYLEYDSTNGGVQLVGAGFYTSSYVSALGANSSGGGGGGSSSLAGLNDVALSPDPLTLANANDVLIYNGNGHWINVSKSSFLNGYLTSVAFSDLTSHPTTLSGYGITDAYISGGTIYLGSNSITPVTTETDPTVPAWAKESTKPSYSFSELTSHPTTLSGYGITDAYISGGTIYLGSDSITPLTSFTETDPTVPSWAKQPTKPSYSFSELTSHPTTLSGYGITDALGSGTKFWGRTESNGVVSGDILINGGGSGSGSGIYLHNTGIGWHTNGTGQTTFVTYGYNSTRYAYEATFSNTAIFSGKPITTNPDGWRIICGNYGTFWRNDGADLFLMFTDSGDQYGNWNSLRPLQFNIASGLGQMQNGLYIYGANQGDATASGFNALRVGDISLVYDSTNNALKIQKADGTAANLYATGGVSALGMSAGTSAVDAMKFGYLTVNTRLTLPTTIVAGNSPMIARTASDSDCIYLLNFSGTSKETSSNYYYNQYDNIGLHGTNYNYDETWFIDPDGCARFRRLYLDSVRYLYVSNGDLYYNNGSQSRKVAFTN